MTQAKIAEAGLGSYISATIMGFFVGALPRQRDDMTRMEAEMSRLRST